MTAPGRAYPADAAGHVLYFDWPAHRDHQRTAMCRGCSWSMPAPGTGYMRARVEHTKAHAIWGASCSPGGVRS